jgi:hypothetical protein
MNDAWNIAQDRQEDVEPELSAQADGEEHADWWKQDSEQDAQKVCHGIAMRGETTEGTAPWPFRSRGPQLPCDRDAAVYAIACPVMKLAAGEAVPLMSEMALDVVGSR